MKAKRSTRKQQDSQRAIAKALGFPSVKAMRKHQAWLKKQTRAERAGNVTVKFWGD